MKKADSRKAQGRALKQLREKKKILARTVADFFEKSIKTIYFWENGEGLTPFIYKMYKAFLDGYKENKKQ